MADEGGDETFAPISEQFLNFMVDKYGIADLGQKYTEVYVASVVRHQEADCRMGVFARMLGVSDNPLPYSVCRAFARAIMISKRPI